MNAKLTTAKQRECKDIVDAALAQGWRLETPKGRNAQHLRLIPPNGGVPVGISCTPSDHNFRRQIVRLMRRSGFIWPPREETPVKLADAIVKEEWRIIDHYPDAEISNFGHARDRRTKTPIVPSDDGLFVFTDPNGFERSDSLRRLCRAAFGHSPLRNANVDTAVLTAVTPRQEVALTPADIGAVSKPQPVHWEPVLIEGIVEGYEVNEAAEILAPKNAKLRNRSQLRPHERKGRFWVSLRGLDNKYRTCLLAPIVLEAFEARPGAHWIAEHIDGNEENCARSNLRWKEGKVPLSVPAPPVVEPTPPARPEWSTGPAISLPEISPITPNILPTTFPSQDDDGNEIVVAHTYTHKASGITIAIGEDGKMSIPEVGTDEAVIIATLMVRIARGK